MVIFLPDPSARYCQEHPGYVKTDTVDCMMCFAEGLADRFVEDFEKTVREVFDGV